LKYFDAIIIGGGVAGLTCALNAPKGVSVALIMPQAPQESSTYWAQGGIAASLGEDDSFEFHAADTIDAGAGLCSSDAVIHITKNAKSVVTWLDNLRLPFDKNELGGFLLGLEAAHTKRRIIHAGGDRIGNNLSRTLFAHVVKRKNITIFNDTVLNVTKDDHFSVTCHSGNALLSSSLVLASGGIGGLFDATTNPSCIKGLGLYFGAMLGATLKDLEFIQFHPTALNVSGQQKPLLTEALRGEGGIVVNSKGEEFLYSIDSRGALAARDIVARGIAQEISKGEKVYLDVRHINTFEKFFPQVHSLCIQHGFNPTKDLLPITPAAHYHMGGIATNIYGETNIPGLYAVGEVGCTGLHGANRLASNSLLEGLVVGKEVGARLSAGVARITSINPFSHSQNSINDSVKANLIPFERTLGIVRNRDDLLLGITNLENDTTPEGVVKKLIHLFALEREESRGAHFRSDFPVQSDHFRYHQVMTLGEINVKSSLLLDHEAPTSHQKL